MSDLFFRNRRLLALTVALILVSGLAAFHSLPRLEDPEMIARNAIVTTLVPGGDAERVESLVTEKIEEELFDVEEIKTLESTSRSGISIIEIELEDEVVETEAVWSRIRDKLDDVGPELPEDALEPEFDEIEVRGYAMIAALTWDRDDETSYAILRRLAEGLEDHLRAVHGTENVELFGEPEEEITVEVDQARLAAMQLTVEGVARQVGRSDSKVSAGLMRNRSTGDLLIEVEGEMDSLARIRRTPIQFGREGQFVQLGDIAAIRKDIRRPSYDLALVAGKPAVTVAAFVDSDYRIDRWAADARRVIADFSDRLPSGVGIEIVFDQSRYTEERLAALLMNLALGAAAVVVVLLFMMGWRSALIVSLSLPLSSLMVLAGMNLLGIPLHQMSVTGLIIALGLLIDNAIVMVDEVRNRLAGGSPPAQAISMSVRHLAVPLLGSTLTTALAFAPVALMPGGAGEFVGTIAISVILALSSSLFLAMTVIPAVTGMTAPEQGDGPLKESGSWWSRGFSNRTLTAGYSWFLDRLFRRPLLGLALGAALPIGGFVAATHLIEQFFPPTGRDMFQVELEMPTYASIDQTETLARQVRSRMLDHPQVRDVHWFMGNSAPSFYYNLVTDQENAAHYAQGIVQLESAEGVVALIQRLQEELNASFPEARLLVRQLEQGPPFDAPIELRLYGPDISRMKQLGEDARTLLSAVPDVVYTDADLTESLPKLAVRVDEEQARLAGLDHRTIARQLDFALEGAVGGSLVEATEELPIRVRVPGSERGRLDRIASLDLLVPRSESAPFEFVRRPNEGERRAANAFVPVSALGSLMLVPERAVIRHRDGRRVNTVRGYITAGVLPGKVLNDFRTQLEQWPLPEGYEFEFGGEAAERDRAVGNLAGSVGVLMVLMVATLVLSFGSFRMAGIIGTVAMLSAGLGLGSLWLFGFPFGFMAIVGTMGLVGVAINDSIVVLAALRENARETRRDHTAVRNVVIHSSRHVLATTVTTIAGFVPLILEGGGFWPPVAVTIAGGVAGATLLALIFVPSAFTLLMRVPVNAIADAAGAEAARREQVPCGPGRSFSAGTR